MNVTSSMSGTVFRILVQPGDQVNPGDEVMILESMKMEIPIVAEEGGTVKEVRVAEGEFVQEGDVVVVLG
ncbi:MAG: acetyl-CoA carboxylase biotin carboxyl carrier protein subunit [Bacillus thermozeamaize]|jgi:acetyl-CoA carboxylase biotin carboxyl carrier protein|uniref:Acetyl-CoA carboxylase biotin carboxyl carrier protein subunit n=1 Tax=Bacillus thermozeamaize TaxID=230954 RepID=A0A1Y3PHN9_9BACI|nr:MAG: acetyl-CoA carboxylase biotin carboxyl carrier protein subunit [Bacillus thermozeamaize]